MKRFLMVAIWLYGGGFCLAQDTKMEIQGIYQRVQSFTFHSGDPSFDFDGVGTNGGGYTVVYNLTEKFGIFQGVGFFGGVEQNGLKMRLIVESQGVKMTKHAGALDLYAKGGIGATHFVFEQTGFGGRWGDTHFALVYGGGTEIKMTEGMYLVFEGTRLTTGLPNLTGLEGRSKWDHSWLLATGVAFHF